MVRRHGVSDLKKLVIVHDELDLPPGKIKVKLGGGTAGHKGLASIRSHLHDDGFVRVRIGIGKPPGAEHGVEHVLHRPRRRDREVLSEAVQVAADAVEVVLTDGVQVAMNKFNTRD